jgi:uncharacterized OsmC-like protein
MTDTLTRNQVNGLDLDALGAMVDEVRADASKAVVAFHVTTRWTGQTRSETSVESYEIGGERVERRFKIVADEPNELLGQNSAPNPQELLLTALNACMAVGYVANAALQGIALDHLEIETAGALDLRGFLGIDETVPPGYRQLDYTVRIAGPGTPEQFQAIHQAVMKTSPNFFNLNQPIRMNGRLEIG